MKSFPIIPSNTQIGWNLETTANLFITRSVLGGDFYDVEGCVYSQITLSFKLFSYEANFEQKTSKLSA